mgnify:CR=1 FL=1
MTWCKYWYRQDISHLQRLTCTTKSALPRVAVFATLYLIFSFHKCHIDMHCLEFICNFSTIKFKFRITTYNCSKSYVPVMVFQALQEYICSCLLEKIKVTIGRNMLSKIIKRKVTYNRKSSEAKTYRVCIFSFTIWSLVLSHEMPSLKSFKG